MNSLAQGLAAGSPSEVSFSGTVLDRPHFFFGTRTHATHEEFAVRSDAPGTVVDVIDNVKLAPRVPAEPGDHVTVQGELVPAGDRPIVHWTHHDPAGRHPDGFIELDGRRYA
jgi:hypothetical protein